VAQQLASQGLLRWKDVVYLSRKGMGPCAAQLLKNAAVRNSFTKGTRDECIRLRHTSANCSVDKMKKMVLQCNAGTL